MKKALVTMLENLDLSKLLEPGYLFNWRPPRESDLVFVIAIVFAFAIVASAITWIFFVRKERNEPIFSLVRTRLVQWLFTTGFVGLLLVFFRWQGIPYFAGRFWLLLWLLIAVAWFGGLLIYLLKKFPKERSLYHERLLRERYLPKSRKQSRQ